MVGVNFFGLERLSSRTNTTGLEVSKEPRILSFMKVPGVMFFTLHGHSIRSRPVSWNIWISRRGILRSVERACRCEIRSPWKSPGRSRPGTNRNVTTPPSCHSSLAQNALFQATLRAANSFARAEPCMNRE